MKPDSLDDLLKGSAREALPPAPTQERLAAAVFAEIDRRRRRSFSERILPLLGWRELFLEPRLAIPAMGLALLIGLLPSVVTRVSARTPTTRESLHLEIFATQAPGIPSTLLARNLAGGN